VLEECILAMIFKRQEWSNENGEKTKHFSDLSRPLLGTNISYHNIILCIGAAAARSIMTIFTWPERYYNNNNNNNNNSITITEILYCPASSAFAVFKTKRMGFRYIRRRSKMYTQPPPPPLAHRDPSRKRGFFFRSVILLFKNVFIYCNNKGNTAGTGAVAGAASPHRTSV